MINGIKFRKADIRDLNDILRLNFELFRKESKEYDNSLNLKWTYKDGKKIFTDIILKKNGFVEVAEIKDKIVGYLCGGITKRKFHRKKRRYAELRNMLIEGPYRKKGIGSQLLRDFINWCSQNKVDYIAVTAFAKNEKAIDFYRNLGFRDYSLTMEKRLK